jgi:hypothetical protein
MTGGKPPVVKKSWELSQLRVPVLRSERLIAEAGDSSGTQRKGNAAVESCYQATASED